MLGKTVRRFLFAFVFVALVQCGARDASAASPKFTRIWVTDMHCENCAKKIRRKLYAVPGVVGVKTSVKADVAVVAPQRNRFPSPRAMWEAVQQAGFHPVKLEGPNGTFTTKPKS